MTYRSSKIAMDFVNGNGLLDTKIEFSIVSRQNFSRRIATVDEMPKKLDSWPAERNGNKTQVFWQFTTADAWIKLKSLSPKFS